MNNKLIGKCKNCDQWYCMECSENEHWEEFCSGNCEREYEKQENEKPNAQLNEVFQNMVNDIGGVK